MYFEKLSENDGITFVNGTAVTYKHGYQVATHGIECKTVEEANAAIASFEGNAGVWCSNGIYYVDHSVRVKTKKRAIRIGIACHQQSILQWNNMTLIWIKGRK